jgi:hypothetical protein
VKISHEERALAREFSWLAGLPEQGNLSYFAPPRATAIPSNQDAYSKTAFCKRGSADVRLASKATELLRSNEMTISAICRYRAYGSRNADALAEMRRFIAVAARKE